MKKRIEMLDGSEITNNNTTKMKGIHGWLLVFLLIITIVHPFILIKRWIGLLFDKNDIYNSIQNGSLMTPMDIDVSAGYIINYKISTLIIIVIIILTVITTLSMILKKHHAIIWSKIYILIFTLSMIILFFMDAALKIKLIEVKYLSVPVDKVAASGAVYNKLLFQILLSLILFFLWLMYFIKSVRVKSTFIK